MIPKKNRKGKGKKGSDHFWKKEHYIDGKKEWIPGHSLRQKRR